MIDYCYKRGDIYAVFENGSDMGPWIYPDNPRYAEVLAYLAEHPEALVPEPVPPPPTPEQLLSQEMQQLLAYLASTDWYRLRKIETGAEIPVDVMTSGAAARARISEIRGLLES